MNKHVKLFENFKGHRRVIPRDFFNEGKLLKCMGVVALKIINNLVPNNIEMYFEEDGSAFNIVLNPENNFLELINYPIIINNRRFILGTRYNSKDNFPLYLTDYDDYLEVLVLNEDGNFTDEFIEHFS